MVVGQVDGEQPGTTSLVHEEMIEMKNKIIRIVFVKINRLKCMLSNLYMLIYLSITISQFTPT